MKPLPELLALSDEPLAAAARDYTLGTYDRIDLIEQTGERPENITTQNEVMMRASLRAVCSRPIGELVVAHFCTAAYDMAAVQIGRSPSKQAMMRGILLGAHAASLIPKES